MPDSVRNLSVHGGVVTPIVTPLDTDHSIDADSLTRLVQSIAGSGADGILVLGSTGEGGHLTFEEQQHVVRVARSAEPDLILVATVPALHTRQAERMAVTFTDLGADAILSAPTFAFDLSASELEEHFRAISRAITSPLIAYQVPSRAPSSITSETLARLAHDGVIAGVKDSSGSLESHAAFAEATREVDGFVRMSGSETDLVTAYAAGFTTFVPGLSNIVAPVHAALVAALAASDLETARRLDSVLSAYVALYETPDEGAGRTSRAIGALKAALTRIDLIAGSTLSYPMREQPGMDDHARRTLANIDAAHLVGAA
ncbi:dihydrodipicolinate synthase family protein [Microbacterium sp. NPDC087592]|uniref:dihydrodipicolinate synthase family protein n=1 Tax=Microbacterium sp. NPDC087592 TaxID=3364193 RepID=UPI0037F175AD